MIYSLYFTIYFKINPIKKKGNHPFYYSKKFLFLNPAVINLEKALNPVSHTIFALFLNAMLHPKYKKVIQTTTYIPHFISTVVLVGLIHQVFHERSGIYGAIMKLITGKAPVSLAAFSALWGRPFFLCI